MRETLLRSMEDGYVRKVCSQSGGDTTHSEPMCQFRQWRIYLERNVD